MKLRCGKFELFLDRPLIMGIVNLTPDSFSGDGLGSSTERAIAHARAQIAAGADMLDLGAESSRPGAVPTSLDDELRRLLPVLEALSSCEVPISVDTYKPEVMRAALAAGASMINDIYGLRMPGALEAVAGSDCGVCIMHMQGEPLTMQQQPVYGDVVAEVGAFLHERVAVALAAGVARECLVLDPGFGFGKSLAHNLSLLKHLPTLVGDGFPVLAGLSRKSMIGQVTGRKVGDRLAGSLAAALMALEGGAHILRVHDVAATRDALAVWLATRAAE
jgi:dihydropteroate synthase